MSASRVQNCRPFHHVKAAGLEELVAHDKVGEENEP